MYKNIFSKKTIGNAVAVLALAFSMTSCDDFVDVVPKGNTIPSTVEDLARLMNNGTMAQAGDAMEMFGISSGTFYCEGLSDDYWFTDDPNSMIYNSYSGLPFIQNTIVWAEYRYGAAETDMTWDNLYHSTYIANYVIENIGKVEESASVKREEVKGRALVFRAMNYFLLTNLYGKQYVKGEANDALSVPLILEPSVTEQLPRATVAEVYNQIMTDLDEAISLLKINVSETTNIPSRAAALALRARVNLWMQNYDEAYNDASAALELKKTLLDYNNLTPMMPGMPMYPIDGYDSNVETNPEILWERFIPEHCKCYYSPKMKAIIDTANDLRYRLFIGSYAIAGLLEEYGWTKHFHSGIDVSEVYLIKAEAAVRKSTKDVNTALATLNALRKNRYDATTYHDFEATDAKDVLDEVLKERRRELIYTEMSFMDKKRQTADPSTAQPMERVYKGVTYTVPVGSPRWQLAIPLNVMAANPKLIQNER